MTPSEFREAEIYRDIIFDWADGAVKAREDGILGDSQKGKNQALAFPFDFL